jgi:hypothetical protein
MSAANLIQTVASAAKPWADLYSNSTAISSGVTFLHLAGLLFAGGLAVSSDRATFRALHADDDARSRLLVDLGNSHRWVLGGLAVIFASGVMLALSDVKTFATSPTYWIKMSLVALLLANGALLQRTERSLRAVRLTGQMTPSHQKLWTKLRFSAAASMTLWTAIVLAGVILVESS